MTDYIPAALDRRGEGRFHSLADAFPLMDGDDYAELVADVRAKGLSLPIVLHEGKILDGRNRWRACQDAGVTPRYEDYAGDDPVGFVISMNLPRRHLTAAQRALIGAKLITTKIGDNQFSKQNHSDKGVVTTTALGHSATTAAKLMGVNRGTVQDAQTVLKEGTPEEIRAVEDGSMGVGTTAREIRKGVPAKDREALHGKPKPHSSRRRVGDGSQRAATLRMQAQVWGQFKAGLEALGTMPAANDTVPIIKGRDRAGLVDTRLDQAINWLKEFRDEWHRKT